MSVADYASYGVLAGNQVVANSGSSIILGNAGSNISVSGSGSISVSDQTLIGAAINDALSNAQNDYTSFIGLSPDFTNTSSDIGGATFNPGVTLLSSAGTITIGTVSGNNTINLDGNGIYFFQLPSANLLTDATLASVSINLINGAKPTQIFWLVNGSVDLQSSGSNVTNFLGNIICQGNVTFGNNSTNIGSVSAPDVAGNITLNSNKIISSDVQRPRDVTTNNYINLESVLSDNQAVTISASSINGGIDIKAGLGGIEVDTTNSISLNAAAASNFTTTNGNLVLEATSGLLNMDSGSGMNIGNGSSTTPILIGSSSFAKNITIGNTTSTSTTSLRSGTGGFHVDTATGGTISLNSTGASSNLTNNTTSNGQDLVVAVLGSTDSSISLQSQGTGVDAINFTTSQGGMQMTAFGSSSSIDIATDYSGSGHVKLSSGTGSGGSVILESGNGNVLINAYNGGVIAVGTFNGGDILLGTAAIARNITVGNATSTTSLVLSSGTGGTTIGNDANGGEIQIGNVAFDKTIKIGNSTGGSRLFERFGTGGHITHQASETALSDSDAILTISQLLNELFTITPSGANRTLTLPIASDVVSGIPDVQVNDAIDFTIINGSTPTDERSVIVAPGSGGSLTGNNTIAPIQNLVGSFFTSGSGTFRLRLTNVSGSTEAYTVYRMY